MRKHRRMKKVFLQGAFDIINWGHVKAFELAKSYGDYLIIGLNSNELIRDYKKREPVLPWEQKKFIIESFKFVDEVVKMEKASPRDFIFENDIDVYCLTEEWAQSHQKLLEFFELGGGEVRFLPRFEGVVCTSDIKRILLQEAKDEEEAKRAYNRSW